MYTLNVGRIVKVYRIGGKTSHLICDWRQSERPRKQPLKPTRLALRRTRQAFPQAHPDVYYRPFSKFFLSPKPVPPVL